MHMIDIFILSCVAGTCLLAGYCGVVYPALLALAARSRRRPWVQQPIQPRVSVIIPARNEAAIIARKLDNVLASDYPADAFEVLVASDCSSDQTDAIVGSYTPRARLIRASTRSGKQVCLNLAAAQASGEVILFTDAASLLAPNAITLLVRHFADPSIGAVSSAIRVRDGNSVALNDSASRETSSTNAQPASAKAEGEGLYLGADCAVRVREGEISSIVGCVGACYAMRRACFVPFDPGDCDDFAAVYNVVACGQRAVMDPQVICEMLPARDAKIEMARKVRTIAGALDTLWRYRRRILQFAPPALLWFLVSHKVCRWLLPLSVLLSGTAVTLGAVFGHWLWQVPFGAGLCLATLGLAAQKSEGCVGRFRILKPLAFLMISLSAGVVAWITVISGKKQVVWQPTPRTVAKTC
jgi:cellulose synthase/poly-beta-1,6-N-acetylglucosamine synthase-like glycosyltransferase